ncbi:uncharacterized protein Nmag_0828 [Natrialba magadii ATCC 43099]|uniref:Uncharacterized protein n=1 Tax=Natrialba magadii (strain ATCC 43099 / DSM 3394 / CCM 3739 / CIP 104546 / IAM 13178 / JCM 8861 / NBRC 102185 / NCIMB 2190 / MS3) TaxID=547559 RepID=D3T054_NATMM|nr:hypothetical protein [Natrialba magadii]ADD04412.1 uncharacterized protein Nmag_0828 [Natrialba magadii ATCC 43099]ELY25808.1 hypothetical protein C500_16659 [Natrialba magadii ATCC 43099]
MSSKGSDEVTFEIDEEWFRFGVYIAFLYAAFTLVIVYLLQFDQLIGLVVAVVGSIVFGLSIMVYVLYIR